MESKQFDKVVRHQIEMCKDILMSKSKEYSSSDDRLHNFKIASAMQECSTREALAGMMAKHTVSVYDMCMSDKIHPSSMWDEKITDHINYLLLLKAVVTEEAVERNDENRPTVKYTEEKEINE